MYLCCGIWLFSVAALLRYPAPLWRPFVDGSSTGNRIFRQPSPPHVVEIDPARAPLSPLFSSRTLSPLARSGMPIKVSRAGLHNSDWHPGPRSHRDRASPNLHRSQYSSRILWDFPGEVSTLRWPSDFQFGLTSQSGRGGCLVPDIRQADDLHGAKNSNGNEDELINVLMTDMKLSYIEREGERERNSKYSKRTESCLENRFNRVAVFDVV